MTQYGLIHRIGRYFERVNHPYYSPFGSRRPREESSLSISLEDAAVESI